MGGPSRRRRAITGGDGVPAVVAFNALTSDDSVHYAGRHWTPLDAAALSLSDVAAWFCISPDAARKRPARGTLRGAKLHGRWTVYLDSDAMSEVVNIASDRTSDATRMPVLPNMDATSNRSGRHRTPLIVKPDTNTGQAPVQEANLEECRIEGCPRPMVATGFCRVHDNDLDCRGEIGSARIPMHHTPHSACSVDGCKRPAVGHGYGLTHWKRWWRSPDSRADVPVWRPVHQGT